MAPVSSKKDNTTTNRHPHVAGSYEATRLPPSLTQGMAMSYLSSIEPTRSNISQAKTPSTPSHGNQGLQKRLMPELRKVDHISTGFTQSGVAHYSYNRDKQLQNEVSNINTLRTQPHLVNNSDLPNADKAQFGNVHILPNWSNDPLNRMYHENISTLPGFFNQTKQKNSATDAPRFIQSSSLNYPKSQLPSNCTRNSSPLYATTDRRDSYFQERNSERTGSLKSVDIFTGAQCTSQTATYTGTDLNMQNILNNSQLAELVQEYLNYLILNEYQFHVLQAQHFLSLKYPHCKSLANSFNSYELNELAKMMLSNKSPQEIITEDTLATARISFKPSLPFNEHILPTQAYEVLRNLHQRQHFAGGLMINGQRQNMTANTASLPTQHSSNLFNSTNSVFISGSRNFQHVETEPLPKLVEISPVITNDTNQRLPVRGVAKESVQQKYNNSPMQIPYSHAQNNSSVITTAPNQRLTYVDLTEESQNILGNKINNMHITTNQTTQPLEHTREARLTVTENFFLQNVNTQKINAETTAVVFENEGLIISYQNSVTAANQECKEDESVRTVSNASTENNSGSSSNNSQVEVNSGTNMTILSSTNKNYSKHKQSSSKSLDTDIKVNRNEDLPQVHESDLKHSPSPNKTQKDENAKILPPNNSATDQKPHVESNINIPILPSTPQNHSENQSPSKPQVEADTVNSKENNHKPESDRNTEEVDMQNSTLPNNQSLEQDPLTEEEFLDEFSSLVYQLDSHNSSTNDLFERLRGIITKSKETADSLKKVFSNNPETSDDTVSSTTSSEIS